MTDWVATTLGEVAHWSSGGTPKARTPAYYEGGAIPWAVIGDLNDGVVQETGSTITEAGLANSAAKIVPEGTLLVAMYGSIGKLGIAGRALATNQAIATARPHAVDSRYLFYFLLSQRAQLDAVGKGATQRNISQTILKAWPIRYPRERSEQRRIVDLLEDHLSRLDAGVAGLSMSRHRLRALDRAALDRYFGFENEGVPLSDLIDDISAGKSFGATNAPAGDDEWGIIKVSAMTWGEFRPEENKAVTADRIDSRFEIRPGDLLVSRANTSSYVGASVLVGDVRRRLLLSDKSLRVTPTHGVDAAWLWRALQAPSARRQISALATGTKDSMRNISQAALKSVRLPLMSTDGQAAALAAYNSVLDSIRATQATLDAQERRASALRRSLLSAAFSGRLTGTNSASVRVEELVDA